MGAQPAELREERVLVLAPVGRDAALACAVLAEAGIAAEACAGMEELCRKLEEAAGAVIVAEEALGGAAVERLTRALDAQPPWSDLPLVIFSGGQLSGADARRTLSQIAPFGNVTLLDRPVRAIALVSTLQVALRARRRQYQVMRLLDELERRVHERDRFLAMLGHELRNPLAAIVHALESLEAAGGDEARAARPRDVIDRQARHLSRLVDDLLDAARVTSSKVTLERAPLDLALLVERCVEACATAAAADGLRVVYAGDGPVVVDGDPVRLEQVVTNLLTNARKYTARGGRIDVTVGRADGEASIRIDDTGVGIAREMLPRIFELFTQAEGSLDRSRGGLGIGLTVVRSLVELHGGSVRVSSEGLGRGSRFEVRLPLSSAVPAPAAPTSSAPAAVSPRSVLIIEDSADIREMLAALLVDAGHRVDTAHDGPTGLERVRAARPEVVLIDVGLPGMDGYDVARAIRAEIGSGILLAAVTGYGQPGDRERARLAGFDAHLTKPVRLKALRKLLDK